LGLRSVVGLHVLCSHADLWRSGALPRRSSRCVGFRWRVRWPYQSSCILTSLKSGAKILTSAL
jgi:hypothetical protein